MSEVCVKRYGVHYEDLHDGVESSEDNGVVSMVQTSDHLAAMEAKDKKIAELESECRFAYGQLSEQNVVSAKRLLEIEAKDREIEELANLLTRYERVGVYRWSGGFITDELAVIDNGEVLYKIAEEPK